MWSLRLKWDPKVMNDRAVDVAGGAMLCQLADSYEHLAFRRHGLRPVLSITSYYIQELRMYSSTYLISE